MITNKLSWSRNSHKLEQGRWSQASGSFGFGGNMTMTTLRTFDGVPNPQDQAPVWVRVTLTVGKTLTGTIKLDWNNKAAQRAFAEYADGVIRAGGTVETKAIE